MMNSEIKKQIADAASDYISSRSMSQNELGRMSGVNPAYLSAILSGEFTYKNSRTKEASEIADQWFNRLADFIGFKIEKEYWPFVPTQQFTEIVGELEDAKKRSYTRVLIGSTGCGKTYSINRFKVANPVACFVITCHKYQNLSDLIGEIIEAIGISITGSISKKLNKIKTELWRLHRRGEKPIIIFDEAENLNLYALQALKALYDFLKNSCGIVLIGTEQLTEKLEKMKNTNKPGMPQLYRRIKAGIRFITPCDPRFENFIHNITDRNLRKLIIGICENYGDLADYLTPVLREADRMNTPISETLFRTINKLTL